jgi:hypothetical protein
MFIPKWLIWALPIASLPYPIAQVPIPRTADGKPDLAGYWQVLNTASLDIQGHRAKKEHRATASSQAMKFPISGGP